MRRLGLAALALLREERGFIVTMLVRTILVFALLGVAMYEGGQIINARIKAGDVADAAAKAAADHIRGPRDHAQARAAAEEAVRESDPTALLTDFAVGPEGQVTVMVEMEASTLVVHRVSFLSDFAFQHAEVSAIRHP
jgi:Flp pilus assembly protein TadG